MTEPNVKLLENVPIMESISGKPDKKAVFFTMLWKYSLFSSFPIGGTHSQGILLVMPLELQGKSTNHSMAQP